jgi:hypothetical protein
VSAHLLGRAGRDQALRPWHGRRRRRPGFRGPVPLREKGQFLDAEIDAVDGANGTTAASRKIYQTRLKELGKVTFDRIEVEPFAVKRFGTRVQT